MSRYICVFLLWLTVSTGDNSSELPPVLNATIDAAGVSTGVRTPPRLTLFRPGNNSFVISGQKTILDIRLDLGGASSTVDAGLPPDSVLCTALGGASPESLLGSGKEQCWADASSPAFLVTGPGEHIVQPYLRTPSPPYKLVMLGEPSTFTSGPASLCNASTFGKPPCMITRPNCGRFLKFRFFLYPTTSLPTPQAAALYQALSSSPLRTDDPFSACVYVGVTDVRAANVQGETLEASASRLVRLPLWGSGENHIVFTFGDYGPGYDTGRAMIAASSYTPPLDTEWFSARGTPPTSLPVAISERKGYDIVMSLPFYRCNLPTYAHLHKYAEGATAALAARPPADRPYLLTFKGSLYEFPPAHPASPRIALRQYLHNGRDIHVALTCWSLSPTCQPCIPPACTSPPLKNVSTASYAECSALTQEANYR